MKSKSKDGDSDSCSSDAEQQRRGGGSGLLVDMTDEQLLKLCDGGTAHKLVSYPCGITATMS